jgi:hypothetical protein
VKFHWGDKQKIAFDELRRILMKRTLLYHPRWNEKFYIATDASLTTLGAVLFQRVKLPKGETYSKKDEDQLNVIKVDEEWYEERPVAFISKKLTGAEQKWDAREREAYAIYWAIEKKFREYVMFQDFEVETDHRSLKWVWNHNNAKISRWAMALAQHAGMHITYKKGETNIVPDALSRMDGLAERVELDDKQEAPHCLWGPEDRGEKTNRETETGVKVAKCLALILQEAVDTTEEEELLEGSWEMSECNTTVVTEAKHPTKPGAMLKLLSALRKQQTHTIYSVDGELPISYNAAITTELGYTLCEVKWKDMMHKHPLTGHDSIILATTVGLKGKQLAKRATQLGLPGAAWVQNREELQLLTQALKHRECELIRNW